MHFLKLALRDPNDRRRGVIFLFEGRVVVGSAQIFHKSWAYSIHGIYARIVSSKIQGIRYESG